MSSETVTVAITLTAEQTAYLHGLNLLYARFNGDEILRLIQDALPAEPPPVPEVREGMRIVHKDHRGWSLTVLSPPEGEEYVAVCRLDLRHGGTSYAVWSTADLQGRLATGVYVEWRAPRRVLSEREVG